VSGLFEDSLLRAADRRRYRYHTHTFRHLNVEEANSPREVALSLQIIFLITIISLAPALLILITSFVRIYIVFSFVSRGLATQTIPPNQVIVGSPVHDPIHHVPDIHEGVQDGIKPYMDGKIEINEGYTKAIARSASSC
jgi:flagellar biosynthetic protein FliP